MKPLAAHPQRTRQILAIVITGLALVLPVMAISGWLAALAGQQELREQRLADVETLRARLISAREQMSETPRLSLVADPDRRARLRSVTASQTYLAARATQLADRLAAAGAVIALGDVSVTVLGGIDEVRLQLTVTGRADAILQALAADAQPGLRVFSFRLDPLGDGEARLVLILIQATGQGGPDAD